MPLKLAETPLLEGFPAFAPKPGRTLAEEFGMEATPSPFDEFGMIIPPEPPGHIKRITHHLGAGYNTVQSFDIARSARRGEISWPDAEYRIGQLEKRRAEMAQPEGFIGRGFYGAIETTPYWGIVAAKAQAYGLVGAAIGGTTVVILGQIPPATLIPEEIITIPMGMRIGYTGGKFVGGFVALHEMADGEITWEMHKQGVSDKTIGWIAPLAALPYAAAEYSEMALASGGKLLPGPQLLLAKTAKKNILRTALFLALKFGGTVAIQSTEEGIQGMDVEAAGLLGRIIDDLYVGTFGEEATRILETGWREATESIPTMFFLSGPGGAVVTTRDFMAAMKERRATIGAEKVAEILDHIDREVAFVRGLDDPGLVINLADSQAIAGSQAESPDAAIRSAAVANEVRRRIADSPAPAEKAETIAKEAEQHPTIKPETIQEIRDIGAQLAQPEAPPIPPTPEVAAAEAAMLAREPTPAEVADVEQRLAEEAPKAAAPEITPAEEAAFMAEVVREYEVAHGVKVEQSPDATRPWTEAQADAYMSRTWREGRTGRILELDVDNYGIAWEGETAIPVTEKVEIEREPTAAELAKIEAEIQPARVEMPPDVQHWIDADNSRPVAEALVMLDRAGILERVEGHSKPEGLIPFSVRYHNPDTGKSDFATTATELKKVAAKYGKPEAEKPAPEAPPAAPVPAEVPMKAPPPKTRILDQLIRWYKGKAIKITPAQLLKIAYRHEAKAAREAFRAGREAEAAAAKEKPILTPKQTIEQLINWYAGEKTELSAQELLDLAMKHEVKAARIGYRAGQLDLIATHEELIAFAREYLPDDEFRLVARALKRIMKTRTPAETEAVIKAINLMVANYERASAMAEFKKGYERTRKMKLRPEFRAKLETLVEDFALTKHTDILRDRMESVLEAVERQEAMEEPELLGEIPQKLIDRARQVMAAAEKKLLRELPPEDIRALTEAVLHVANMNRLKNELLAARKGREAEAMIGDATQTVRQRKGARFIQDIRKAARTLRRGAVRKALGPELLSLDTVVARLLGESGAGREILFDNLKEGDRNFVGLTQHAQDYIHAALQRQGFTLQELRKLSAAIGDEGSVEMVSVKAPSGDIDMTRGERISILAFLFDPDNRFRLFRNKQQGITFARFRNPEQFIKITPGDAQAIVDSAGLRERAIALAMFEYFNGPLRDAVNATSLEELGFEIWPRKNHWTRRRDAEFLSEDPSELMRDFRDILIENLGIFKPRTGGNNPFVIDDAFSTFFAHTFKGYAYATKMPPTHDAMRLLHDAKFRVAVMEGLKYGREWLEDIKKTVLAYQWSDRADESGVESALRQWMPKLHVAALGLKPHIIAYQKISILNALVEIDAKYLLPELLVSPTTKAESIAEMVAWSPLLRARQESAGHQILTPMSFGLSAQQFYGNKEGIVSKIGLKPIHWSDIGVIAAIWRAAKAEAIAEGLTGDDLMRETARRAEKIVDRSQPTWDALTTAMLARHGRKNALLRLMALMFSSQRNKNFNQVVRAIDRFRYSKKTAADYHQMLKGVLIPTIVNAISLALIEQSWQLGLRVGAGLIVRGEPPEEEPETLAVRLVSKTLQRLFGTWLVAGDAISAVVGKLESAILYGGRFDMAEQSNLVVSAFNDLADGVIRASRALVSEGMEDEVRTRQMQQAALELASGVAPLTGLPLMGLAQIARPFIKEAGKEKGAPQR